jgi:hypothetical protein
MNFFAATSVESLLVLLLVMGLSALSPWLAKKRAQHDEAHHLPRQAADAPPAALVRSGNPEVTGRDQASARPPQRLDTHPVHPAAAPIARPSMRSRDGAAAVALVRHSHTVRQAFIASLVFGEPKTFET